MAAPHRELKRAAVPNAMGHVVLAFAERTLRPAELGGLREQLWRTQTYLYVTPIPTNFRDTSELPPLIAAHFAPLIDGSAFPDDFDRGLAPEEYDLARFQRSLAPI